MRQVPILMYHWFRSRDAASTSRSPQLEITRELFTRQMQLLSRRGWRTVSLREALDGARGPGAREVVLTFDDGTRDFQEVARPVLERFGFSATLFVVTGKVGGASDWDGALGEPERPLLSWEQIVGLHEAGFEIGSHTHTHRALTDLSDSEAADELTRSRELLGERLGAAPGFVAYPRGFFAERHGDMARAAGYRGACAVILDWGDLGRSNRYALRRMTVKGTESMLRFRLRLGLCKVVRYTEATRAAATR